MSLTVTIANAANNTPLPTVAFTGTVTTTSIPKLGTSIAVTCLILGEAIDAQVDRITTTVTPPVPPSTLATWIATRLPMATNGNYYTVVAIANMTATVGGQLLDSGSVSACHCQQT